MYRCKNGMCGNLSFRCAPDAVCSCGNVVQYIGEWTTQNPRVDVEDGVFGISGSKFIITDDLQVALASTRLMFSLMDQFGIPGNGNIEEKCSN